MVGMLERLTHSYRGKKVFLTGHTGFKGAWLLKTLNILGADVRGYGLAPKNNDDLYNLIYGEQICDSIISDLRAKEELANAVIEFQPDFIFHLAAQPLVRLSYEIPSETFQVNAIGTANLLDAVRLLKKQCAVILITTDKVYHNNEWAHPYRETDRLGGYDPYSASKACAEIVIDSYRNSFFNIREYKNHRKALAVGRAGNVIGGGDWSEDRLMPDIIKALAQKRNIIIRNPNSVRPWQHVLEPVVAYLLLGSKVYVDPLNFSKAYNFGPYGTDALPVKDMLDLSINSWGSGAFTVEESANRVHEAGLLKLDISKALTELGWQPKFDAKQAVSMTIDWYKAYFERRGNVNEFTETQVTTYLNA